VEASTRNEGVRGSNPRVGFVLTIPSQDRDAVGKALLWEQTLIDPAAVANQLEVLVGIKDREEQVAELMRYMLSHIGHDETLEEPAERGLTWPAKRLRFGTRGV
jgi:hypothetical protein